LRGWAQESRRDTIEVGGFDFYDVLVVAVSQDRDFFEQALEAESLAKLRRLAWFNFEDLDGNLALCLQVHGQLHFCIAAVANCFQEKVPVVENLSLDKLWLNTW